MLDNIDVHRRDPGGSFEYKMKRVPGVDHKLCEIILNQNIYNRHIYFSPLGSSWTTPRQHRVSRNDIILYIKDCDVLYQRP